MGIYGYNCYSVCHDNTYGGSAYVSGTTCDGVQAAYYLNLGQCACMDLDFPLHFCNAYIFSGECVPSTPTPTMTPTNTQTPSITPTNTITPTASITPSETPTLTPTSTNTPTPSITPTNTITPTPSITSSATPTLTPSITPSITPTRTATPTITPTITPSSTPNCANCGEVRWTATTAGSVSFTLCFPGPGVNPFKSKSFGIGTGSTCDNSGLYCCDGASQDGVDVNSLVFNVSGITTEIIRNCCDPTPTPTPSITASPTRTPSQTPSQTATRTMTPTPSITPSSTPNCANCTAGFTVTGSSNNFTVTARKCFDRSLQSTSTTNGVATLSVGCPGLDVGSITITTSGVTIVALQTQGDCCPVSPTPTATSTATPTITPSITPSITPTNTSTPTPSITASQTATPTNTLTPTNTETPTNTPTPSITASQTATPTITPTPSETSLGGQLFVYAKYIGSSQEVGYTINSGTYLGFGTPGSECAFIGTINGLTNGDSVDFMTIGTCAIGGDLTTCPAGTSGCNYNHIFNGTTYIYLTIDASNCC